MPVSAAKRAYYEANKDKIRERNLRNQKAWRKSNKGKGRAYNRRRVLKQYGLTVEQYDKMFDKQGGVCLLCKAPPRSRSLHVDHCHETGKVRGLLCYRCNYALGLVREDVELLRGMIKYLLLHRLE